MTKREKMSENSRDKVSKNSNKNAKLLRATGDIRKRAVKSDTNVDSDHVCCLNSNLQFT